MPQFSGWAFLLPDGLGVLRDLLLREMPGSSKSTSALTFAAKRLLGALPILQGVRERTLVQITKSATQLRVPRRTFVYRPQDECTGLYIIVAGEITLEGTTNRGREKVFALLGRADWFGETALILRRRHDAGAKTTETATTLLHVPKSVVLEGLNHDHAFALRLLGATCQRLRSSMLEAEVLGTTARSRLATFLLEQVTPSIRSGAVTITLSVSRKALASRLNLSPEHLSRVFRALAQAKMLAVDRSHVLILDVARLRKQASDEAQHVSDTTLP